jgi:hypothetical protein
MSNPIKYSTGTESLALKKGNFYIGTGDVGKGPTSSTGYYNGITPPSGGYTIYLNKETGGPSIYTASNDSELIGLTNSIAGTSYTTANECLVYFAGQNDKVVLNRDYEGIVTDGLILNLDAGFTPSYPRSGTTWYDNTLSGVTTSLINGVTFDGNENQSLYFDGSNDYSDVTKNLSERELWSSHWNNSNKMTICCFIKKPNMTFTQGTRNGIIGNRYYYNDGNFNFHFHDNSRLAFNCGYDANFRVLSYDTSYENQWTFLSLRHDGGNNIIRFSINNTFYNTNLPKAVPVDVYMSGTSFNTVIAKEQSNCQIYIGTITVHNKFLTDDDVLNYYNAQKGRFGL